MQQPSGEQAAKCVLKSVSKDDLEPLSEFVLEEVLDEVILGVCFEVHRAVKQGFLFIDTAKEDERKYEIVDEIGLDVFGQVPLKKQFECVCPNCHRNLAASRFAPHLEKCMGMGRNSSRIASKRIANTGKVESDIDDYDNDSDWNYTSDRKASSKKKKDKNSPRRPKIKGKNGESSNSSTTSSESVGMYTNYESLSPDERKALLVQMCGVISEHTKKMCTRSHRCPQHTDEQRKAVRLILLGKQGVKAKFHLPALFRLQSHSSLDAGEDVQVDVDTLDEGDSQNLQLQDPVTRLWESSNSNHSPADSASTASGSSISKKKEKRMVSSSSSSAKTGTSKKNKMRPSTNSSTVSSMGIDVV